MGDREIDLKKLAVEPFEVYRSNPALGSGAIRNLLRSPAYYVATSMSQIKETPALRLGKLVHMAILEPEQFRKNFIVQPSFDRRTKEGKANHELFMSDLPKDAILGTQDEMDVVEGALKSALAHRSLSSLLIQGVAERSLYFEWNGVKCKCRPDYLTQLGGEPCIVELKTTQDARWEDFQWSIKKFKYHVQAAFYIEGVKKALGVERVHYAWAAIEKEPPYDIAVHEITPTMPDSGRRFCEIALETFKTCTEKKVWPGYSQEIEQHDDPSWLVWE